MEFKEHNERIHSKIIKYAIILTPLVIAICVIGIYFISGNLFNQKENENATIEAIPESPIIDSELVRLPKLTSNFESNYYWTVVSKDINFYLENNQNPWNEQMKINKLPVYARGDGILGALRLTFEETREYAKEISILLKSEIINETGRLWDNKFSEGLFELEDGTHITISPEYTMRVVMPNKLDLSHIQLSNDKLEYTEAIFQFYFEYYRDAINYINPIFSLSDYGINYIDENASFYPMKIYDKTNNIIDNIVSYSINNVKIQTFNNEHSDILFFNLPGIKLGDYPIISLDEAKKKLLDDEYLTDGEKLPGLIKEDEISGVELNYSMGIYAYPVYTFYIQLNDEKSRLAAGGYNYYNVKENDQKVYQVCYVPAIQDEYYINEAVDSR